MTVPALEVNGLTVGYTRPREGVDVVVSDVDLALESGKILGLAGESGCGKSTAALAMIGYRSRGRQVLGGTCLLEGVDLLALPSHALRSIWGRRIAYVAQDATSALNPALTIGEQLAQPLTTHLGLKGQAVRRRQVELLDSVGLPDPEAALTKHRHQFSGGQLQRISIAIALACRPEVLILDEPTTGLDVTTQARISALLKSLLHEVGVATLYVSHDLALLATLADQLAVMYAGEIVELGPVEEVCRRPLHPYTRALLGAVPSVRIPRLIAGIQGSPPSTVVTGSCAFAPRCPHVLPVCRSSSIELTLSGERRIRCVRAGEDLPGRDIRSLKPERASLTQTSPLLEIRQITHSYRSRRDVLRAVTNASFTISHGETLGLVGESGSGKSTLLRIISGLIAPQEGIIWLEGSVLAQKSVDRSREHCRQIQLVFQNPDSSLNPRHTVGEIVGRPARLFREGLSNTAEKELVADLFESVKLPLAAINRYPDELSGGQKQRVAIARAFAAEPLVLLCDEITSALDVSVQATILEMLAELAAKKGTAVVFVSHDLAVVRTIADRAVVMNRGEIVERGDVSDLFQSPKDPYTKELLSAIPELP